MGNIFLILYVNIMRYFMFYPYGLYHWKLGLFISVLYCICFVVVVVAQYQMAPNVLFWCLRNFFMFFVNKFSMHNLCACIIKKKKKKYGQRVSGLFKNVWKMTRKILVWIEWPAFEVKEAAICYAWYRFAILVPTSPLRS